MTTTSTSSSTGRRHLARGALPRVARASMLRLALLFALLLSVLVSLVGFTLSNFDRLIEANRWNSHTYQVMLENGEVLEGIVAMDSSLRTYLVTGNEAAMGAYRRGRQRFEERIERLTDLTSDRPAQQQRLRTLRQQLASWEREANRAARIRASISDNARSLAITSRTAGARTSRLNLVRQTIESIEQAEMELLRSRSAQQARFQVSTGRTLLLGGLFSIVLTSGLCALVLSNTRALSRSHARLEEANASLSEALARLSEHKEEIEAANHELSARQEALERANANFQRANTELARSNAELEQFAYVASHDLQEPLRAVAGCVQVLQRRYQGHLDARADQFIHHAVEGAQRMQNLIHDLLLFSRVGTRGKPFEPADLNAVLGRALSNLSVAIRESAAQVTHDPLPTLACDAGQIEQVLQNLIANALKFRRAAPEGEHKRQKEPHAEQSEGQQPPPQVLAQALASDSAPTATRLLPPVVHIGARHDAERGEWVISVSDQGPGIESQYFQRIWVMFQRLHTRAEYAGTGIGLAVCKKVVERHGGRVGVESTLGQGSTFWFSLPEVPPEAPAALTTSG